MKSKLYTAVILSFAFIYSGCDAVFEDDLSEVSVELLSPSDGAELENSVVQFQWDSVKEALEYNFQLVTPSFSSELSNTISDTTLSEFSLTRSLDLGEYEWRVKAINSSSESDFSASAFEVTETSNISSLTPEVTLPLTDQFLNDEPVIIMWEPMTNADEYFVRIYDYTNHEQGELVWTEILSETESSASLEEGSYLLTVQGTNSGLQFSQLAEVSFVIDRSAPSQPLLTGPDNLNFLVNEMISFEWLSGADVESTVVDSAFIYTVSPSLLVYSAEVESPFDLDASELGEGNFDWSIVTYDQAGNGTESNVNIFSVSE